MLSVRFTPFPVLVTDRLILRRITIDDANEIFFLRNDESVMKYIDRPRAKSLNDVAVWLDKVDANIANDDAVAWGVSLKGEQKLIATTSFHVLIKENYRAEIGYVMHPAYHGKGYMQEAVKAMISYGFNSMGLHSIEAQVNPENGASIKVLERAGFVREAYFKENYFWDGKFLDSAIYSLLAPR